MLNATMCCTIIALHNGHQITQGLDLDQVGFYLPGGPSEKLAVPNATYPLYNLFVVHGHGLHHGTADWT